MLEGFGGDSGDLSGRGDGVTRAGKGRRLRSGPAVVFALVLGGGFAALSVGLHELRLSGFDDFFRSLAVGLHSPALTWFMFAATSLGSATVMLPLGLGSAVWLRRLGARAGMARRGAQVILLALAGAFLLSTWLKVIFHRMRPDLFPLVPSVGYSYPSGHAMAAIAFYPVLAYVISVVLAGPPAATSTGGGGGGWLSSRPCVLGGLVIVVTLLIGASRIYLGVHFASDVVGGYLAGGAWAFACLAWFEGLRQRDEEE
jgi:undecaprenyl-diphosphatase